jgi:hypothetical protein
MPLLYEKEVTKIKLMDGWKCKKCNKCFGKKEDAVNCCNATKLVYMCRVCEEKYNDASEAESCCPRIDRITESDIEKFEDMYKCWNCHSFYEEEKDAKQCCPVRY